MAGGSAIAYSRSIPGQAAINPPVTKHRGVVDRILTVLLVVAVLFALTVFITSAAGIIRIDTEQSGSMQPAIPVGAAVVVAPEPATAVHVGQTIAYTPPRPYPQITVIHKVVSVRRALGHTVVQTRGVANQVNDPWVAVLRGHVWHVIVTTPVAGYVVNFARSGIWQLIILIVVGASIALGINTFFERRRHATPLQN